LPGSGYAEGKRYVWAIGATDGNRSTAATADQKVFPMNYDQFSVDEEFRSLARRRG
jgi:hypothetical protein